MLQGIIQYDHADMLSIGLMLLIPILASWGMSLGIIGLTEKGERRIFAIIGTGINGSALVCVLFLWAKLILFLSNLNSWID
jgi:hypothetical protein